MFYYRTKQPRFFFSSLLAVGLFLSHFSFQVLEEVVCSQRISYLRKVHFEREVQRKADQEKFQKIEEKDQIQKAIKKYKPDLRSENISELTNIICEVGDDYNYDPTFLLAMIFTESSMKGTAVSSAGAMGLMQIRPFVGKDLAHETKTSWNGSDTLLDPQVNIKLGAHYLGKLFKRFNGDLRLALEAYNNGPTMVRNRVNAYGDFSSSYSQRVLKTYEKLKMNTPI